MPDFAEIVATHADVVWRTAVKLLSNEEDARDCYQQTFLEATRLDANEINNWRSLLCSIATRRAMDQLRKRYRYRERHTDTRVEPSQNMPPDRRLIDDELRADVRKALTKIPAQQAEAFWLRHIEQLAPSEIAEQLTISAEHVRVLVHRAAKHLRESLQPVYGTNAPECGREGDKHEYQ